MIAVAKELVRAEGLTELEIKVLNAARHTNFGDCMEECQWSFAVCDEAKLSEKVYRGVVASLVKKGLIWIEDNEGRGLYRDMVFGFKDAGEKLFEEDC